MPVWMLFALIAIGLVAIFVEFFIPSFGIIAIAGFGCLVAAVVLGYVNQGASTGTAFLVFVLVATPVLLYVGLKLFPRTFLGKWLILWDSQAKGYVTYPEEKYAGLIGKEGIALSDLRPSGMALFGERKLSVVTAGEYIGKDDRVKVIAAEGSRIVVRRITGTI